MSYILEALKKSERERELGSVPKLGRFSDSSEPRERRWLGVALVVSLLLCGVLLAWNFNDVWHSLVNTAAVPAELPPAKAPLAEEAAPAEPRVVPRVITQPRLSPTVETDRRSGELRIPTSESPAPAELDPAPAVTDDPEPIEWPRLDPGLRAQLPPLAINVLSYSATPEKRFVMINQRILREGQALGDGVELSRIQPDGAVLRFRDTVFLLRP